MKKNYFLFLICILSALKLNAQTDSLLHEDFNVDPTATWATINNGNDTVWVSLDADQLVDANALPGNWFWDVSAFSTMDTTGAMISSSWFSSPGRAANYMITPPVTINNAGAQLSWKSAAGQTPLYLDGYKVLVSTTDNIETSFTDTIFVAGEYLSTIVSGSSNFSDYNFSDGFIQGEDGTYTEVDTSTMDSTRLSGIMQPFLVSLAAYAGQTIYVAFLHDSFDDYFLAVDDVLITEPTAVGINENELIASMNIYPNPTRDKIRLDYTLIKNTDVTLSIYDNAGKLVYTESRGVQGAGHQQSMLNLESFANGIYSVKLNAGDIYLTRNIMVNR